MFSKIPILLVCSFHIMMITFIGQQKKFKNYYVKSWSRPMEFVIIWNLMKSHSLFFSHTLIHARRICHKHFENFLSLSLSQCVFSGAVSHWFAKNWIFSHFLYIDSLSSAHQLNITCPPSQSNIFITIEYLTQFHFLHHFHMNILYLSTVLFCFSNSIAIVRSAVLQCQMGHLMCAACFTHLLADGR